MIKKGKLLENKQGPLLRTYSSNQKITLSANGTTSRSASTSFGKPNTKYLYLSLHLLLICMEFITVRLHCMREKQHMACMKYVFSFNLSKMNKMFSISAQFVLLSRGFQSLYTYHNVHHN